MLWAEPIVTSHTHTQTHTHTHPPTHTMCKSYAIEFCMESLCTISVWKTVSVQSSMVFTRACALKQQQTFSRSSSLSLPLFFQILCRTWESNSSDSLPYLRLDFKHYLMRLLAFTSTVKVTENVSKDDVCCIITFAKRAWCMSCCLRFLPGYVHYASTTAGSYGTIRRKNSSSCRRVTCVMHFHSKVHASLSCPSVLYLDS